MEGVISTKQQENKKLIQDGFDRWAKGTASIFDLLADDAEWTIAGRNLPTCKTYTSRKQFLEEVVAPLYARLSTPLVPKVRSLFADGDYVIALFDATAVAKDGKDYKNTYAWCMKIGNGRIVNVVALFDTAEVADLWKRIPI
jgi:ketosteroid isomerase-like protein